MWCWASTRSDARAENEAVVREVSAKRMKAIAARDVDGIESYYYDDAWQLVLQSEPESRSEGAACNAGGVHISG
jgi:ketosteroid isomerase-like protein